MEQQKPNFDKLTYGIIAAVILVVGILYQFSDNISGKNKREFEKEKAYTVEAGPVIIGPMSRDLLTAGSLRAFQTVSIHPETEGIVSEIYFTEGTQVEAGQPLVKLDQSRQLAEVKSQEANLAFAKSEYERDKKLHQGHVIASNKEQESYAKMIVAEAQLEKAKVDLEKTVIYAPFSGVTSLSEVNIGSLVSPSTEILTLVDLTPLFVDFFVPEKYIKEIYIDQKVVVISDTLEDEKFEATVDAIDPKVDPNSHSFKVRAKIANQDQSFRPGMFVRVKIPLLDIKEAVLAPESCISREGTDEYVYRVVDNISVKTAVVTGQRRDGLIEIVDGLFKGDVVISAGIQKVRHGDVPVEIVGGHAVTGEAKAKKDKKNSALAERGKINEEEPKNEEGEEAQEGEEGAKIAQKENDKENEPSGFAKFFSSLWGKKEVKEEGKKEELKEAVAAKEEDKVKEEEVKTPEEQPKNEVKKEEAKVSEEKPKEEVKKLEEAKKHEVAKKPETSKKEDKSSSNKTTKEVK